eukprot:1000306-Pleurochrysis_carterae.AAC.1
MIKHNTTVKWSEIKQAQAAESNKPERLCDAGQRHPSQVVHSPRSKPQSKCSINGEPALLEALMNRTYRAAWAL